MRLMPFRFFIRALTTDLDLDEIVDELRDFDDRFRIILRKHLAVLGWWCILNLLTGIIALFLFDGALWYFFLMNISWAIINFSIVVFVFDHTYYQRFTKGNSFERFEVQRHVEKMLLLNIGLDLTYIFAGLFMWALSFKSGIMHPDLWLGFGWSVIIQGSFLLLQDNVIHYLHLQNFKQCRPFLEKVIEDQLAQRRAVGYSAKAGQKA